MDYRARFYDGALGRFIQPDTFTPGGPQGLNRYAYAKNNPIRYKDPSGHTACDEEGNCWNAQGWSRAPGAPRLSTIDTWKMMIKGKFGANISDEGGKQWSLSNLKLMYKSLQNIDSVLNGKLRSFAGGWTLKMAEHKRSSNEDFTSYQGWTSSVNSTVTFYTMGSDAIRQMNIYHEFGHLLDKTDTFTNALAGENNPSYINANGYVSTNARIETNVTTDLNYKSVESIQASGNGVSEQWADIFANYVAGNINMGTSEGSAMFSFVTGALAPYTGIP
jgi:hypothetical protein